jgi:hypothetical protein
MSVTPWVPTVQLIQDGQAVEQAVVNVPLEQLIQRDQHLYDEFAELQGKSVLISFGTPIYPGDLTGDSPIQLGQLNVVYYRKDVGGEGMSRAQTGFSSSNTSSMFAPNDSNYVFGIIKSVNPDNTVDCFISGICELLVPIDDPINGLLEVSRDINGNPVSETFQVGPYYLSRKLPGKLTANPDGIPVYVGYAISPTVFLLQPSVDEFSQFFINYRYNILDRPVYPPVLGQNGTTWSIPTPAGHAHNPNRLGWIAANSDNLPGYTIPTSPAGVTAKFFYYIPKDLNTTSPDKTVLNSDEIIEATELGSLLPPVPSNFVEIMSNGVVQRYADVYSPDGIYSIDDYGIWWYADQAGLQPWADDILSQGGWDPTNWETYKGSNFRRSRLFISFAKFNPALRTQLVSSLRPFGASSNFVSFYLKDNPDVSSPTGDLLVKITPQFISAGETPTLTTNTALPTDIPDTVVNNQYTTSDNYTAGSAVADLTYDQNLGKFVKVVTPVVAKLTGGGGISVTPVVGQPGSYNISYLTNGVYGLVDSIEPINSRLEFRGLNSYIRLPYTNPVTVPYGLIGKVVLTKNAINNVPLNLVFQVFGNQTYSSGNNNTELTFTFEYSATTAKNGAAPTSNKNLNSLVSLASAGAQTITLNMPTAGGYTAYTPINLEGVLTIPAEYIAEDTVVNFKIVRNLSGDGNNYTGDIGILGIYWGITNS